jgi:phosphotransferase system enzyme I (PtsI)
MKNTYMQARAADIRDISNRILRTLGHGEEQGFDGSDKMIIAAEDLAPSETVQFDKERILGFVTSGGSTNSHTAILARTIGIPAVVSTGEQIDIDYNGKLIIIDGFSGIVYIDPDEGTLETMQKKQHADEERKQLLQKLKGVKSVTRDGHAVEVFANITNSGDMTNVMQNDAEGIGLFRSEFIYLENKDYPTEEQQFSAYKLAVETMAGKKVVIRTLDIGADKQVDYFNLDKEANPAMGLRAIRICLTRPEIFKTQLRALCRASAFGKLAVMFPMIISVDEVRRSKALLAEVQEELKAASIAYDKNMEIGIMIETPAAAIMSDELAKEVDFFSIGTNDLSQYTMAIDRQNQHLSAFFDRHHPALLRLIATTVKNGHDAGIWVGICGELGADFELTETFLRMGVDELSVSPALVLPLRRNILSLDLLKK